MSSEVERMNYQHLSARDWIQMAQVYFNFRPDSPIPEHLVATLRDALSDKSEEVRSDATRKLHALMGR
jgi:hypothetical protein